MSKRQTFHIWLLIAALWLSAAGLWFAFILNSDPLSPAVHLPIWLFAASIFLLESDWLTLKLSPHTSSTTFALLEVALLLGALFADPTMLVPTAALSAYLVYRYHRKTIMMKAAFNAANFTLRLACTWVLLDLFRQVDPLSPVGWLLVGAAMAITSITEGVALAAIKAIAEGQRMAFSKQMVTGYSHFVSFTATTQGLVLAIMVRAEPLAGLLFIASVSVLFVASYAYVSETTHRAIAEKQAATDAMTGIANRGEFDRRLDLAIDENAKFGIVTIDLDNFKTINDNYGHQMGDAVLIEMATRLQATIREEDLAARTGGDEFAVLLEYSPGISELLKRLGEALNEPILLDGEHLPVGASLGFTLRIEGEPKYQMMERADQAMYDQKQIRRGNFNQTPPESPSTLHRSEHHSLPA